MRTLSITGILFGFFIAGMSIWRWGGGMYDIPFKMWIGIAIAIAIIGGAYMIDWMTMKEKHDNNTNKKIDEVWLEIKNLKELNDLK